MCNIEPLGPFSTFFCFLQSSATSNEPELQNSIKNKIQTQEGFGVDLCDSNHNPEGLRGTV